MILSDRDLRRRLRSRSIVVEPLADLELQLQPASIDLRLGCQFRRAVNASEKVEEVTAGEDFVLGPGEFALGTTLERVHVPPDLVARVEGRSSIGRLAVLVHATAGFSSTLGSKARSPSSWRTSDRLRRTCGLARASARSSFTR